MEFSITKDRFQIRKEKPKGLQTPFKTLKWRYVKYQLCCLIMPKYFQSLGSEPRTGSVNEKNFVVLKENWRLEQKWYETIRIWKNEIWPCKY